MIYHKNYKQILLMTPVLSEVSNELSAACPRVARYLTSLVPLRPRVARYLTSLVPLRPRVARMCL